MRQASVSIWWQPARMRKCRLLGVCLGHQAIGQHFGGKVVRGGLMHGKTSPVDCMTVAACSLACPRPSLATRYHSLIVEDIPGSAASKRDQRNPGLDGTAVMGFRHASCRSTGCSSIPKASRPNMAMRCSPISCAFAGWKRRHRHENPPDRRSASDRSGSRRGFQRDPRRGNQRRGNRPVPRRHCRNAAKLRTKSPEQPGPCARG